jgi:hypothetical protein
MRPFKSGKLLVDATVIVVALSFIAPLSVVVCAELLLSGYIVISLFQTLKKRGIPA